MNPRCLPVLLSTLFCLHLHAQKGTIAEITLAGLDRTKQGHMEKLIVSAPGMVLDSLFLEEDVNRIKRLPSIAHAYYEVVLKEDGRYTVRYTMEENFTLIPYANLFSSANDDFAFRIGLQEFNFLGRNITLGAFYQLDVFHSFGFSIRAPYLFSNKFGLAFNYNDFSTQEPVFFSEATADYKYSNTGFELLGLYQFDLKNNVELGFSLFTEDYEYLFGATQPNVPLQLNVDKHLMKLLYNYSNIDYFYHYLEGFQSNLNFQVVGSTDEALPDFLIGFNDFSYYKRIGQQGNWASRLRLGLASNVNSPFAPFTVDNNLNIRGVGNTIDRGTGAIVLNTEYRHTLFEKKAFVLQSNVFVDGGSWRNPGGTFGDFLDRENVRIYPGVGLRFIHKKIFNAIFRIDYGYGITTDGASGLVFGIGQYF